MVVGGIQEPVPEIENEEHLHAASAKRVVLVDNSGNLIGVTSSSLDVNVTGGNVTIDASDIQIGAVEVKNATDDTRAKVKSDGVDNALVVVQNSLPAGTNNIGLVVPAHTDDVAATATDATVGSYVKVGLVAWSPLDVRGTDAEGAAPTENPNLVAGWDGTNVYTLKTDASGQLQIDVLSLPVLPSGTNLIGQVKISDGTETVNVNTSNQLEVSVENLVDDESWSMATGTLTSDGNLIAAPSAGNHLIVRSVTFCNSDTSNSGRIDAEDGSGGSVLIRCWMASDGGGFGYYFGDKPLVLSSATALYGNITTTTSVDYTIQYKTVAD